MQVVEERKRQPSEDQSDMLPKVKILFYSLTRINGARKSISMNDPEEVKE